MHWRVVPQEEAWEVFRVKYPDRQLSLSDEYADPDRFGSFNSRLEEVDEAYGDEDTFEQWLDDILDEMMATWRKHMLLAMLGMSLDRV